LITVRIDEKKKPPNPRRGNEEKEEKRKKRNMEYRTKYEHLTKSPSLGGVGEAFLC